MHVPKELASRPGQTGGCSSGLASSTLAQTMAHEITPEVYQLHVWIQKISPMIGRRLLRGEKMYR
jgi:hypothetical protein